MKASCEEEVYAEPVGEASKMVIATLLAALKKVRVENSPN